MGFEQTVVGRGWIKQFAKQPGHRLSSEPYPWMSVGANTPAVWIPDWLGHHARTTPRRPALIANGQTWSFAELDRWAQRVAGRLAAEGVGRGDHVGALMGNSPEFVALVHALIRLGAVLVPLNTRLAAPELRWQAKDAGVGLLAHDDFNATKGAEVVSSLDVRLMSVEPLTVEAGELAPGGQVSHCIDLSAVHSIIYTSGTTGRPKGAMLTYGNHWWSAHGSAINLGAHRDDRWLACLPLFHVGGLAILLRCAIYGVPVIVHPSFDPAAVNSAIDEQGVTLVSVVSDMLRRMLAGRGDRPYPPGLRGILLGGGPAPLSLLEECARRGVPVLPTYGMTETASQAATLSMEDALRKQGSAGKPLMPGEILIETDDSDTAPGEAGEIVVRGPNVTPGYWNRPEDTARAFRGGWFHTGDIGRLDAEGYLYVLDRRDDLIVSGGENVYPAEVEAVLLSHPAVEDAGVTGVPDERWGRAVVASVKLRPGAEAGAEELRTYCRKLLAGYKAPSMIKFVDALPRNAAGKLLRRVLREG